MKEINFYCIKEDANVFLYSFLSKLIEKDKRVIIYSENQEKIKKLDDTLWNMKKVGFLPHLIENEKFAEQTPIVLSNKKENKNNANFLLISTFLNDFEYLSQFEKIFYIFSPINNEIIENTLKAWNIYRENNFSTKLLEKNNEGKWIERTDFIIN